MDDRTTALLNKINTLMRLNSGALELANRSVTITTTVNNLLRFLLDQYPVRFSIGDPDALMRKIDASPEIDEAFLSSIPEAVVPFAVVRRLMRNAVLDLQASHFSMEWREFVQRYRPLFDLV